MDMIVRSIRKDPNKFFNRLTEAMSDEDLEKLKGGFIAIGEETKEGEGGGGGGETKLPLGGVFSLRFRDRLAIDKENEEEDERRKRLERRRIEERARREEKLAIYEEEEYLHDLERRDIVNFYFGMHKFEKTASSSIDPPTTTSAQPETTRSSSFSPSDVVSSALQSRVGEKSERDERMHAKEMAEERLLKRSDSVFGAHYGGVVSSTDETVSAIADDASKTSEETRTTTEYADALTRLGITRTQLAAVSLQGGVPFVVFGFIDNFIMIVAGDAIDVCFAHTLGLSMLACAGLGNMVSDVVGQTCGGFIEAFATRLGLPDPKLNSKQRASRIVKTTHVVSGTVGIGLGCLLGMVPLLFLDTHAATEAAVVVGETLDVVSSATKSSS